MKHLLIVLVLGGSLAAQSTGAATIALFTGAPSGSCTMGARTLALDEANGALYTCTSSGWTALSTGGGGAGLNGCTTPTAGNLSCTSSVAVGTGTEGVLSLAYSALPGPASTALGEFAANASGAPYYSPGNNTAFAPLALANSTTGLVAASSLDTSTASTGLGSMFLLKSGLTNCNWMGWSTQTGAQTCADLEPNIQTGATYTIATTDINHVIMQQISGAVTDTLAAPTGGFNAPFPFWIDTRCQSTVTVNAGSGALINGATSATIAACGWAFFWADANGTDWHAQIYQPPGGVTVVQ